jgi:glycosyltransferase involved in cell wall biosynthesis
MKILYAGTAKLGVDEGGTIHFLHLARALQARGHQLTIVARGARSLPHLAGLDIHPVPQVAVPRIGLLLDDISFWIAIGRLGLARRFDLVYHRGVPAANQWARYLGIPSIVEVNGIQVDELRARGMPESLLRLRRIRELSIVRGATRVICVTEGIRDQLESRYQVPRERCTVVPNATDTEMFEPRNKIQCQQQVGLQPGIYHIGFVGSFQPWLDFESLFTAAKALTSWDVPIQLTLVGDGHAFGQAKQQVEAQGLSKVVRLAGRVPHEVVPCWIGAFDVCVAPFTRSRNERIGLSPLKLFEYLACARPVVATALPGVTETLKASQSGLTYEAGNGRELAEHLHVLYRESGLREVMGARGREYVVREHSWHRVAERTEAIMLESQVR